MKHKLAKLWRWGGPLSGVLGLVILFKLVDVQSVLAALKAANPLWLALAALLVLLTAALRARRWTFLFHQRRVAVRWGRLLRIVLIDSFYGQFLPASSAVGATLLFAEGARGGGRAVDVIATVLIERVSNLLALFVAASLILLVAPPFGLPSTLVWTVHLAALGLLVGLWCLRRGWGLGALRRLLERLKLQTLGAHLDTLRQALQSDLGQGRVVARALLLSGLVNASMMLASYLVTLAVAGPLPVLNFMAMATLIITLQGIPITPGALGMREGLHVFFLGLLGVSGAQALTVGLLVTTLYWLQGLVGGLVLLAGGLPALDAGGARRDTSATRLLQPVQGETQ